MGDYCGLLQEGNVVVGVPAGKRRARAPTWREAVRQMQRMDMLAAVYDTEEGSADRINEQA